MEIKSFVGLYSLLLILTACGGGGGGTSSPPVAAPTPPPTPMPSPPPPAQAPTLAPDVPASIAETVLRIGNANAEDANNDPLTFALSGPDAESFMVLENGDIVTISAFDFETPADRDGDNTYVFTLSVDDGVDGSASADISFSLQDVPYDGVRAIKYEPDVDHRDVFQPNDFGDNGAIVWGTRKYESSISSPPPPVPDKNLAFVVPVSALLGEGHENVPMGANALTLTVLPKADFEQDADAIQSGLFDAPQTIFVGRNGLGESYLAISHTPVDKCAAPLSNDTSFSALVRLDTITIRGLPNPLDLAMPVAVGLLKRESANRFRLGGNANIGFFRETGECFVEYHHHLNRPRSEVVDIRGDFNGDGATDIVYTVNLFERRIYGPGTFIFVSGSRGPESGSRGVFDMRVGEAQPGEVVFLETERTTAYLGNGGLFFRSVGDVTGDGADDFALGDPDGPTLDGFRGTPYAEFYSIVSGAALFADPDGHVELETLEFPDVIRIDRRFSTDLIDSFGDLDGDGLNDIIYDFFLADHSPQNDDRTGTAVLFGSFLSTASDPIDVNALMLPNVQFPLFGDRNERLRDLKIVKDLDGDGRDEAITFTEDGLIIWPGSLIAEDLLRFKNEAPLPDEVAEIWLPGIVDGQISTLDDIDGDNRRELIIQYRNSDGAGDYLIPSSRITGAFGASVPLDLRGAFD